MTNKKKLLLAVACMALAVCSLVTGTIAWLTAEPQTVTNTFAPSNITLTLAETTGDEYKMIPGSTYAKDPKVTVTANIKCYVFVKIEKSTDFDNYMSFEIADGWNVFSSETGVYYRVVEAADAADGESFYVLNGEGTGDYQYGYVTIREDLTLENMPTTAPKLTFTAYACQFDNIQDVAAAWELFADNTNSNP